MITSNIETKRKYRHKKSGGVYVVIGKGMMKIGPRDSASWEASIVYVNENDAEGMLFTRDVHNFKQNFEEV